MRKESQVKRSMENSRGETPGRSARVCGVGLFFHYVTNLKYTPVVSSKLNNFMKNIGPLICKFYYESSPSVCVCSCSVPSWLLGSTGTIYWTIASQSHYHRFASSNMAVVSTPVIWQLMHVKLERFSLKRAWHKTRKKRSYILFKSLKIPHITGIWFF